MDMLKKSAVESLSHAIVLRCVMCGCNVTVGMFSMACASLSSGCLLEGKGVPEAGKG